MVIPVALVRAAATAVAAIAVAVMVEVAVAVAVVAGTSGVLKILNAIPNQFVAPLILKAIAKQIFPQQLENRALLRVDRRGARRTKQRDP